MNSRLNCIDFNQEVNSRIFSREIPIFFLGKFPVSEIGCNRKCILIVTIQQVKTYKSAISIPGKMNLPCVLRNDRKIHICFSDMRNKKYKDQKTKEIVSTFCAVLNSQGGRVTFELRSGSTSDVQNLKRAIEQQLSDLLGFSAMRDHINLVSSKTEELMYIVDGVYSLCTMSYNLYVPSEKNNCPSEDTDC